MRNLYRVHYTERYMTRDQSWDFDEEVTYVWAKSDAAAIDLIDYGNRSNIVAVEIQTDDPGYQAWLRHDPDSDY